MTGMALHAEIWLAYLEQHIIYRTVAVVTYGAVFGVIGMFIYKGPFLFAVAACAGFLDRVFSKLVIGQGAMRFMAIGARHAVFRDRMVTW